MTAVQDCATGTTASMLALQAMDAGAGVWLACLLPVRLHTFVRMLLLMLLHCVSCMLLSSCADFMQAMHTAYRARRCRLHWL